MTNEPEYTDVVVNGPAVVQIDADRIAQIICEVVGAPETLATRAANLIVDYLIETHQGASKPQ